MPKLNRAQRRAMKKKNKNATEVIADTAERLNYINLLQKLRELNARQEKEIMNDEDANEDN